VESLAHIDLSEVDLVDQDPGEGQFAFEAYAGDIADWFYRIELSEELSECFVIDLSREELDELGVSEGWLALRNLPMGFSWAPAIAEWCLEDSLADVVCAAGKFADAAVTIRHGDPPPAVSELVGGKAANWCFLDDFGLLGLRARRQQAGVPELAAATAEHLRSLGLVVHKEQFELPLQSLGAVVALVWEPSRGCWTVIVRLDYAKGWRLYDEVNDIVGRCAASPEEVSHVLGSLTWLFLLLRPLLAVFSDVYEFVNVPPASPAWRTRLPLPAAVCAELELAALLLPFCVSDLGKQWHDEVTCVDASPDKGAVVYCHASRREVAAAGRLGFARVLGSTASAREAPAAGPEPGTLPVEPVGLEWGPGRHDSQAWHLGIAVVWRHEAHNGALEASAALLGLRRALRACRSWNKRILLLTDSLSTLGALQKGRSSSPAFLLVCRRVCVLSVLTGSQLVLRYVPTWLNCADGPTRALGGPGVDRDTVRKALQKHRELGRERPESLQWMCRFYGFPE